jgi:hypothetical protein
MGTSRHHTRVREAPRLVENLRVLVVGLSCTISWMFSCSCTCCWRTHSDETSALGSVPHSRNVLNTLLNTMIRNSVHRKPLTEFFNNSSDTTIAEAVNMQHISICGICEDVRHFSQHSNDVDYQLSQRLSDASHRFTCFRQWLSTAGRKGDIERKIQTTVQWNSTISETIRNRTHVQIRFFAYNDRYYDLPECWPFLLGHRV